MKEVKIVKTLVLLPEDQIEFIQDSARNRGCTLGDVIRQSITNFVYLNRVVESGGKILIHHPAKTNELRPCKF